MTTAVTGVLAQLLLQGSSGLAALEVSEALADPGEVEVFIPALGLMDAMLRVHHGVYEIDGQPLNSAGLRDLLAGSCEYQFRPDLSAGRYRISRDAALKVREAALGVIGQLKRVDPTKLDAAAATARGHLSLFSSPADASARAREAVGAPAP